MDFFLSYGLQIGRAHLRTALSVYTGRNDSASIASPFATGKESAQPHMLQCLVVTDHSHGRTGSCLSGDERGLIGQEAMSLTAKHLKPFAESRSDGLWQPKVKRTGYDARRITGLWQVITQFACPKIRWAGAVCCMLPCCQHNCSNAS